MTTIRALVVCTLAWAAVPATADVWDVNQDNDNNQGSDNELIHGSLQLHDLGVLAGNVADEDWYRVGQKQQSSYEVVVDATSGDIAAGKGVGVFRMAFDATTTLQTSQSVSVGLDYARSLRWQNINATPVNDQYIRVLSTGCNTDCGPDDVYRIRFYETTFAIPRFNASSGQATVLLIQNPTAYDAAGNAYFWNAVGVLLWDQPFTVPARSLYSLNAGSVSALAGQTGTITVSHNARYGDLVGKAVALEPATGFSFDSPMVWRPR